MKEFRVRSGIVWPAHVHLRVAETGAPVPEGRTMSMWIVIEKQFVIVAPTRSGKPEQAENGSTQSIMRIILISSDTVVNPVSCMRPACLLHPGRRLVRVYASNVTTESPPGARCNDLPCRPGFATSVTANSETPRVRPGPVSTSTGTQPSRLPLRHRARGWPPRGCEHAHRAGIGCVR